MSFTFLIVNLNGERSGVLKKCLSSLKNSIDCAYQVIVCDNGSNDNSIELINTFNFDDLLVLKNKTNIGPSKARHEATKFIKHEITFILDNDAYIRNCNYKRILKLFKNKKKLAIIQPLILINHTKKVDYFGDFLTNTGFLKQKHEPLSVFNGMPNGLILSSKSAATLIRTSVLKEIGSFNPYFFIYLEETDLGWRSWLHGYFNITDSSIIVDHGYGSTSKIIGKKKLNFNSCFYGSRNYLIMLTLNLELNNLIRIIPLHLLMWIIYSFYCLLIKFEVKKFYFYLLGIFSYFKNLNQIIKQRVQIQSKRVVKDEIIFKKIMSKVSLGDLYYKAVRRVKVGNLI